jgi:preprotein translocase subunit SecB
MSSPPVFHENGQPQIELRVDNYIRARGRNNYRFR